MKISLLAGIILLLVTALFGWEALSLKRKVN